MAIDRLSELPDSVLTHLLSFLPTKECVATSILSRRWRFLWQYVPVIDLSSQNQDAISRVLLLHKVQSLDAFLLSFNGDNDSCNNPDNNIEAWIIAAIERNVRILYLCFNAIYVLPSPLFKCETLVDLCLVWCGIALTNPYTFSLPHLKKLCLESFQFDSTDFLPRLLSACPVLEELQIRELVYKDVARCNVSSHTIKRLEFILTCPNVGGNSHDCRVELNAPALEHLQIDDHFSDCITSGPLCSLTNAKISFCKYGEIEDEFGYHTSVLDFVNRLNEVKSLEIFLLCRIQDIDSLLAGWTVRFNNLTKLELTARTSYLPKFLESADNLQFLHFREGAFSGSTEAWIEPQRLPICLQSHLRSIKLGGLSGSSVHELDMIRYLLKNAQVLEMMEISCFDPFDILHPQFDPKARTRLRNTISQFERASETCELRFESVFFNR